MKWADILYTMSSESVMGWDKITDLPIMEFLFKLGYLIERAKRSRLEANSTY